MTPPAAASDPKLLDDLKRVSVSRAIFESLGAPLEYWEVLCLARVDGKLLERELRVFSHLRREGQFKGIAGALLHRLIIIREWYGSLVQDLRKHIARLNLPMDTVRLDMILGLVVVSEDLNEAACRWVADPDGQRDEALRQLEELGKRVDEYRRALLRWRVEEADSTRRQKLSESSTILPAVTDTPAAPALPPGVDPEVLEDVRRVVQCRQIFSRASLPMEVWEALSLVTSDRKIVAQAMDDLSGMNQPGLTQRFSEGAKRLFEQLLKLRSEHGPLVRALRGYFGRLPIGRFGPDTMELTLAFIVNSPQGRQHAKMWLERPDDMAREAATRIEGVVGRALKYQRGLNLLSSPKSA
jgi:hypothetical protein